MKTINPMHGVRVKSAGVFAMLIATCILFFPGCQGPLATQNETGTLSLTIGGSLARTIMPPLGTAWAEDFAEFRLDFFDTGNNIYTDEPAFSQTWGGSGTVTNLYPGTWHLVVTAFLPPGVEEGLPAARGIHRNLPIALGPNQAEVTLSPIAGGNLQGTFSWDIGFPEGLDTVAIEVRTVAGAPLDPPISRTPGTIGARWADNLRLPTGRYMVILRMGGGELGSVAISEILHVYSNLTSHFQETFTNIHFPRSLLDAMVDAWNGTTWVGMNIGYLHFTEVLEVVGVGDNFSDIVAQFRTIAGTNFPGTTERLRVLIDAAQIGTVMDENWLASPNLSYRNAVHRAIEAIPDLPNGSIICIDNRWAINRRSLTVRISNEGGDVYYNVVINFGREIPILPPLTGTVRIDGGTWVESTLRASITGSNATDTESFTFQWVRIGQNELLGQFGETHEVVAADLGFRFSVIVTHPDFSGSVRPAVPTAAIRPRPIRPDGDSLAEQLAWLRSYARSNGEYIVEIRTNEILTPAQTALPTVNNVTIVLRGIGLMRTINLASNGSLFTVGGFGMTLVLDENVTLMGRGPNATPTSPGNNNALVVIDSGGTLVVNTRARIMGNTNVSTTTLPLHGGGGGGGVSVNSGGLLILDGGVILENSTTHSSISINVPGHGGGVRVNNGGRFDMRNGTIAGNVAASRGGGVHIMSGGTFRMSGGTVYGNDITTWHRNAAGVGGSAALHNDSTGTAQYGTFDYADRFTHLGNLGTTNYTIRR